MSKAAKRAAKRAGRPRKSGARHACGKRIQPSVSQREAEVKATVVSARVRVFGLTRGQADTQGGGSAVGRLALAGLFGSKEQALDLLQAAEAFRERRHAADAAIGHRPLATTTNYTDSRGGFDGSSGDDPDYVARCERARLRFATVREAVLGCGAPLAMFALELCVLEDRDPADDVMLGALRGGLNAIHRALKYERKRR